MSEEIKVTEDGRMLCPNCLTSGNEIELFYHILHHRKDIHRARFIEKNDKLVIIEKPIDGDTIDVYDEYLHCPQCGSRHNVPWSKEGNFEQDMVDYLADVLKMMKPDEPAHRCPRCGNEHPSYVEKVDVSRNFHRVNDGVVVFDGYAEICDGEDRPRFWCSNDQCQTEWSIPPDTEIDFEAL